VLLDFFTMLLVIHAYHVVTLFRDAQSALIQIFQLNHNVRDAIPLDSLWSIQQHAKHALKLVSLVQVQLSA
jgi:hypothetical protein